MQQEVLVPRWKRALRVVSNVISVCSEQVVIVAKTRWSLRCRFRTYDPLNEFFRPLSYTRSYRLKRRLTFSISFSTLDGRLHGQATRSDTSCYPRSLLPASRRASSLWRTSLPKLLHDPNPPPPPPPPRPHADAFKFGCAPKWWLLKVTG